MNRPESALYVPKTTSLPPFSVKTTTEFSVAIGCHKVKVNIFEGGRDLDEYDL